MTEGTGGTSYVSLQLPPSLLCVVSMWPPVGFDFWDVILTMTTLTHTQRGFSLRVRWECISLLSCRSLWEHVCIRSPVSPVRDLGLSSALQEGSRPPVLVGPAHGLGYREDGEGGAQGLDTEIL